MGAWDFLCVCVSSIDALIDVFSVVMIMLSEMLMGMWIRFLVSIFMLMNTSSVLSLKCRYWKRWVVLLSRK